MRRMQYGARMQSKALISFLSLSMVLVMFSLPPNPLIVTSFFDECPLAASLTLDAASDLAWSPDGAHLAVVDYSDVLIFDTTTWELDKTISGAHVSSIAWSPASDQLAGVRGGRAITLNIWDVASGLVFQQFTRARQAHQIGLFTASRLSWSPDGQYIATDGEPNVLLWHLATGNITTLGNYYDYAGVVETDWSPESRHFVSGGRDGIIRIWDFETGQELTSVFGGGFLDWSPQDGRIVSSNGENGVVIWDENTGDALSQFELGTRVLAVGWNGAANMIAAGGSDGSIAVWNTQAAGLIANFERASGTILSLAWHPNSNLLAVSAFDTPVNIWNIDACSRDA